MDRQYISTAFTRLFVGICALLLIVTLVYHTAGLGTTALSTVIAEETTFENIITGEGYFFRDESVLTLNAGASYSTLSPGENVSVGDKVATAYPADSDISAVRRYDKLIDLISVQDSQLSAVSAELKKLSAELRKDSAEGALSDLIAEITQLQKLLNQASYASGGSEELKTELERLKNEQAALLSNFGAPLKTVYTPVAGCYYPDCDGYEELFSAEKVEKLTVSSFEELIKTEPTPKENAGKVVTSSYWYMVTVVDSDALLNSAIGKEYTVYVGSAKEQFTFRLERVTADKEGKSLLVFGCRITPHHLLARAERISIVAETHKGLTVPTAAVRVLTSAEHGNTVGVYVREGNYLRFKQIEIITEQKGCYLVKTAAQIEKEQTKNEEEQPTKLLYPYLSINDVVVTSGKKLEEGYFR